MELLDTAPRTGLAGQIAFLHPRACSGVLVEVATPPASAGAEPASPLGLKRLVIGADDVRATAGIFQSLFGFSEVAMNGGPRTMLAVGRGTLLVVPAHEVGGTAGMVALSFVAEDFAALTASLRRAGTPRLDGNRRGDRGAGRQSRRAPAHQPVHVSVSGSTDRITRVIGPVER